MLYEVPNDVLLALILTEWAYVIYWTRTVGRTVISKVLSAVVNLRPGRGTKPTVPEAVASNAAVPDITGIDPDALLNDPRAQELMAKVAADTGLPLESVRAMAADYLGGGGAPPAGGPAAPLGNPSLPRGAANPLAGILGAAVEGKLDWKAALVQALPLFLQPPAGSGGAPAAGARAGGSNW